MVRYFTTVMVLAAAWMCAGVSAAEVERSFAEANNLYEQKDYAGAIRAYQSILDQGVESGELYFNLGNACFKSGDLGRAVLYYFRAKRLSPNDRDIIDNLAFARRFSSVQMEGVQLNPINAFFVSIVDGYRLSFLAWVSSAIFVMLMGLLVVRAGLGVSGGAIKVGVVVVLVLLVASASLTAFKYRHEYLTRRAVILAEESPVYTGASDLSSIELQGAPGLVVEILDQSGEYFHVLFENKRRGWIKTDLVAEI